MPLSLANRAQTTLNGSISTGSTSITVTSAVDFPPSAPFRILVYTADVSNVEYMEVTAGAGTTTWTVTRAVESATRYPAFAFPSGAKVAQVFTAGTWDAIFHATTGHDHSATSGNGPKLKLDSLTLPFVRVASTDGTHQSIPNATNTVVTFGQAVVDGFSMWSSGDPTVLTIPTGQGGVYAAFVSAEWYPSTTGYRFFNLERYRSGAWSPVAVMNTHPGLSTFGARVSVLFTPTDFAAGEKARFIAYQDSGGSLTLQSYTPYTVTACMWRVA